MLPLSLRYTLSLMLAALHYFLTVTITSIITTTTNNNSSSIKIDYKDKAHWMFRLQRTVILSTHPFVRFPILRFYL